MKRYFLQILGVALAISPMFGQNDVRTDDENGGYVATETTYGYTKNDEQWTTEVPKVTYRNEVDSPGLTEPMEADALFVYPNPSRGVVQLKLTGKISVYVYTLSGQFVQKNYMAPGEKILDLSNLPAGVYHVMAKSDEDYFSGKLIIQ